MHQPKIGYYLCNQIKQIPGKNQKMLHDVLYYFIYLLKYIKQRVRNMQKMKCAVQNIHMCKQKHAINYNYI